MGKEGISRRDLMRKASTAAGTAPVGNSFFLDARETSAALRLSSPSDTLRFGMVGIGMQGSGLPAVCARRYSGHLF